MICPVTKEGPRALLDLDSTDVCGAALRYKPSATFMGLLSISFERLQQARGQLYLNRVTCSAWASRPWLGSSSSGSSVRWWVMDGRSHQRIFAVRDQGRQVKNDIQTRGRTQNPATAGASHHPITSCYRSPFRLQLSVARGESSSARPSIEGPHSRPGRYCITILV